MKRLAILAFSLACFSPAFAILSPASYQGLWYNPQQSGWGINVIHQGDTIFATWFTYDKNGNGMWLVMPEADLDPSYGDMDGYDMMYGMMYGMGGSNMPTYSGTVYQTQGPAFNAPTFDSKLVKAQAVGTAQFQFYDANNGSFSFTIGNAANTVAIARQVFAALPTCTLGGSASSSPNFSDLWWRTGGTESGWGVNVTHQGNILFGTWFTYDANGNGEWLVMPGSNQTGASTWTGALYRTQGSSFDGAWDANKLKATQVGTATFTFSDGNNGTFSATVDGATISKPITRQIYATPTTVCR